MIGQAWALFVLRAQLFRNTLNTSRLLGTLFSVMFTLVMGAIGVGAGIGLYVLAQWMNRAPDAFAFLGVADLLCAAFLLYTVFTFLADIQRQDQLDLRMLLHLPVSPRMAYLLNFGVSLLSYPLIFLLCGAAGLSIGLARAHGPTALLGTPLAILFYVMVMGWVYYLRGLVAVVLINKRRRRALLAIAPIILILLFQIPSILTRNLPDSESTLRGYVMEFEGVARAYLPAANMMAPPGWFPYAAQQLLYGSAVHALIFTLMMLFIAALGIRAGYRSTLRYYMDGAREESGARGAEGARMATGWRLPLLDEDTSAMTGAAFLTYLRHPNIRMMFIMPFIMGGVILLMYHPELREKYAGYTPRWMPMLLLLWPYFNFTMIFFNLFGMDGHGFRGLMLLPTPRYKLLLAKNLALFPFVAGVNLLFILLGHIVSPFPPMMLALVLLHILVLFFSLCIPGNLLTLYLPYRIGFDAMRQRGNRPLMFVIGLVTPLLLGVLFLPTTFCLLADGAAESLGIGAGVPIGLIMTLAWGGVVAAAYRTSLVYAGDLFVEREPKMLESLIRNLD